jgi:cadmium resistance protein CadD (predicted permease)
MAVELLALFIPIIGIVLGVTIAIVAIITGHRQKLQRNDMRHKERLAAIEKGMEIPPEPVEPENGKKSSALRSGLIGLFVGIVLYFALRAVADSDIALFGLIPAAVGLANLLAWFLDGRKATGKKE